MVMPWIVAALAGVLAWVGETLHARRVKRVARLAFGPEGRGAPWTRLAPAVRMVGLVAVAWGAAVLWVHDPVGRDPVPAPRASRQLLIALDVSPSMLLEDSGPNPEKVSRSAWAGKLVQGVLDRLDMSQTRITLVAFYTKALTVLKDTVDKSVVSNMFDGLQLHVAFEPGPTDLTSGVNAALAVAKPWARRSATLVIISDGDARTTLGSVVLPPAIADTIVIGVGDPHKATVVSGHSSKQETWSLEQLAARLGGVYHEGNTRHLPTNILRKLRMLSPAGAGGLGLRETALIALAAGGTLTAFIGPLLQLFGLSRPYLRQRRKRDAALGSQKVTASRIAV